MHYEQPARANSCLVAPIIVTSFYSYVGGVALSHKVSSSEWERVLTASLFTRT